MFCGWCSIGISASKCNQSDLLGWPVSSSYLIAVSRYTENFPVALLFFCTSLNINGCPWSDKSFNMLDERAERRERLVKVAKITNNLILDVVSARVIDKQKATGGRNDNQNQTRMYCNSSSSEVSVCCVSSFFDSAHRKERKSSLRCVFFGDSIRMRL